MAYFSKNVLYGRDVKVIALSFRKINPSVPSYYKARQNPRLIIEKSPMERRSGTTSCMLAAVYLQSCRSASSRSVVGLVPVTKDLIRPLLVSACLFFF